jgi:Cdc6-like AAA superfamily ATPase
VINQAGQHALVFGERGVGKTSLSNVLTSFLGVQAGYVIAPRVNCDTTDTFETLWRKVFDRIDMVRRSSTIGFGSSTSMETMTAIAIIGENRAVTPDAVQRVLMTLSDNLLPIIILDEFDRLSDAPRRALADLIKALSDNSVGATIILVGVAESVEQLIAEHQSVERALVQIRMPRMDSPEISKIITNGVGRLSMTVSAVARARIAKLAQGLPHYAHLLGLYAVRAAADSHSREISEGSVKIAMGRAIQGAQQTIQRTYAYAIRSARVVNLFEDVLLSCALAKTDELGWFAAVDVRTPLRKITGKQFEIPSFAQHLNEFCDEKRGNILIKDGAPRLYRYRFANPLLQPFIVMRGVQSGKVQDDYFDE